jgi:hypothetical protein
LTPVGPPSVVSAEDRDQAALSGSVATGEQDPAIIHLASDVASADLAVRIARIAERFLAEGAPLPRPAPLYVRAADAAPPRDPAPLLLP